WRSELYVPSTIIYRQPGDGDTTYVHRLDEVGPRAWLAHRVETMPEAEMAARLAEPGFDAQQTVLVAGESPAVGRAGGGAERVAVDVYRPNRIEVEVTAQAAGLLVLSEVDYPGWRATVDGQPARIVRVDSVLRGVPVGAGRRRVTLVFAPPTFWLGAAISGLALLYCAAMIIFRFRRMWSPSG
ncbi:MAG: YfhO family protein, partial [Anaerolineae bacterium]